MTKAAPATAALLPLLTNPSLAVSLGNARSGGRLTHLHIRGKAVRQEWVKAAMAARHLNLIVAFVPACPPWALWWARRVSTASYCITMAALAHHRALLD